VAVRKASSQYLRGMEAVASKERPISTNMTMLVLNNTILLVSMRARNFMRDANVTKKGI
jgi:hypothetical protein